MIFKPSVQSVSRIKYPALRLFTRKALGAVALIATSYGLHSLGVWPVVSILVGVLAAYAVETF